MQRFFGRTKSSGSVSPPPRSPAATPTASPNANPASTPVAIERGPLPEGAPLGISHPRAGCPDLVLLVALVRSMRRVCAPLDVAIRSLNADAKIASALTLPPPATGGGGEPAAAMEVSASDEDLLLEEKERHPVLCGFARAIVARWLHDCLGLTSPRDHVRLGATYDFGDARRSRDYFVMRAGLPWHCPVEQFGRPGDKGRPLWIARVDDAAKLKPSAFMDASEAGLGLRGFVERWLAVFHRTPSPLRVKTFTRARPNGAIEEWIFLASATTGDALAGLYAEVFPEGFSQPRQNEKRAIIYAIEATEARDSNAVWRLQTGDDPEPTTTTAAAPPTSGSSSRASSYRPPASQTPSRALLIAYVDWIGVRYGPDYYTHLWVDPPTADDPPLLFKGTVRSKFVTQVALRQWYVDLFCDHGFDIESTSIDLDPARLVLPQFSSELDVKHSGYVEDPRFHSTGNFGVMADKLHRLATEALEQLRSGVEEVNELLARWTLVVKPRYTAVGLGPNPSECTRVRIRRFRTRRQQEETGAVPAPGITASDENHAVIESVLRLPFPTGDPTVFAASSRALYEAPGEGE